MEHLKRKTSFSWKDLLFKTLLFIGTVALIVYFLPRDSKFNYQFDINKPWKYGQLIATFDFPIYKDQAVVEKEQDSLLALFQPYYELHKDVEKKALRKLKEDYHSQLKKTLPSAEYLRYIERTLKDIYQAGIVSTENWHQLHKDSTQAIMVINDKLANSHPTSDIYTVKEAYEFAIENGITYTQSLGFMAGEMKAATLKLMMRGVKAKPTLALGRTKEQAQMLYDESCKSLGEGESKKRYVPRALNIILKKEKFSFDMVIEALRTIPSSEVTMAKLADCGEKEACIAGALISWILTLQRQKETKTAA